LAIIVKVFLTVEPNQIGQFDDTQLEAIDQLMVDMAARQMRLIIALHDRYR
jgi:mannan endo-1,4-beta-mannosidase